MAKFFALLVFLLPFSAFAYSHNWTCAELSYGTHTCTDDVFSYTGTNSFSSPAGTAQTDYDFNPDTVYYVTFTSSGTGTSKVYITNGTSANPYTFNNGDGDQQINVTSDTGTDAFDFFWQGDSGNADIGSICVSDTSFDECIGSPAYIPPWVFPSFSLIIASTSEAGQLAWTAFYTPFMIILAILMGGLFAVMIRKWIWNSGKRVFGR